MRWLGLMLAAWAVIAGTGPAAALLPADDYLASWGQGGVRIIQDGTSNTITFGENTRFNVCFDNVQLPGTITDGTSNTIQFGENSPLFIVPGGTLPRVPITSITDGSSNTILFPEANTDLCLRNVIIDDNPPAITDGTSNTIIIGEDSRFDICFRNVGVTQQITDGTSNTILIGEQNSCYTDLQVAAVPAPSALLAALGALAVLPFAARRRRR